MRPRTRVRAGELVRHRSPRKAFTIIALLGFGLALLFVVRRSVGDGAAGLFDNLAGDPLLAIPTTVLDRSPEGRLTWPALMATLGERTEWRRCASPAQVGTVAVDLSLDPSGLAQWARRADADGSGSDGSGADGSATGSELADGRPLGLGAEVETCVLDFARGLRFAAPTGTGAQLRLTFHFEPGRTPVEP